MFRALIDQVNDKGIQQQHAGFAIPSAERLFPKVGIHYQLRTIHTRRIQAAEMPMNRECVHTTRARQFKEKVSGWEAEQVVKRRRRQQR